MILRITEQLDVPLRERNQLLLAGGYAPAYPMRSFDEPELASVRAALRKVLAGHDPYPAVVVNRYWEMLDANSAVSLLISDVASSLLEPPVNVLRLTLHPDGLAPRITNLAEWRARLLGQLERRVLATNDPRLAALLEELRSYPGEDGPAPSATSVVLPMKVLVDGVELSFFSIAASVETAYDVTVEELVIESFYPADAHTAEVLRARG